MNPWLCLVTSTPADGMSKRGTGLAVEKRQAPAGEKQSAGRTPPSRGREGTHPTRISLMQNVETPQGALGFPDFVEAWAGPGVAAAVSAGIALAILNAVIVMVLQNGRVMYASGRDQA